MADELGEALRTCGVALKAKSSAGISCAASARLRRMVPCMFLTTPAIDGDNASLNPASLVWATPGRHPDTRQSSRTVFRQLMK